MHCQSCQDVNLKNAAWCYRFIVILEDEHTTIPVLIADHEAVCLSLFIRLQIDHLAPLFTVSASHIIIDQSKRYQEDR